MDTPDQILIKKEAENPYRVNRAMRKTTNKMFSAEPPVQELLFVKNHDGELKKQQRRAFNIMKPSIGKSEQRNLALQNKKIKIL